MTEIEKPKCVAETIREQQRKEVLKCTVADLLRICDNDSRQCLDLITDALKVI